MNILCDKTSSEQFRREKDQHCLTARENSLALMTSFQDKGGGSSNELVFSPRLSYNSSMK